jgi:outer membrane lipoprotein carrier protein
VTASLTCFFWVYSYLFATPSSGDASTYVKRFEAVYRSQSTLQTTFLEGYTENGHVTRTEAGTAYFRRPGKMRWEYESPERDLFLVDGKIAWFYVPGDHTVMRVPAKQSTDWRTPLALLAGEMKVSRVCSRVELAASEKPEQQQDVLLRCQLRGVNAGQTSADSDPGKSEPGEKGEVVFFEIARDTGELARLLVRQSGGVQVEFRFANWRMNPSLPESLFQFQVPRGVAIVNGELPGRDTGVN